MSEAPERIWAFLPDIFDGMSVWQNQPSPNGDTIEYIRKDVSDAAIRQAREDALREARNQVLGQTLIVAPNNTPGREAAESIRSQLARGLALLPQKDQVFDFQSSFRSTVDAFDGLPDGKKADYYRSQQKDQAD